MAGLVETKVRRRWSAGLTAGVTLVASLALGTFTGSAGAEERRWQHREHREYREDRRDWNREYYRAPPVVYGSPYYTPYYAPPVVYGPGFGLNFNFR